VVLPANLARNEEDLGWVRNRLKSAKKNTYAVNTGRSIHDLGSRVEGVIAAEFLEKLKADTHRGLRGRAERGLSAGGRPYGYRTEELPSGKVDPHGRSIPDGYRLVIHEPEAAVVRRIFEAYAQGEGLRSIAHRLNAEGITSPRRKGWASSAVQAMLRNPIYRGEYVWNRSEWIKDHETGKYRRFERPEADWIRQTSAEWQIVGDDLWERARAVAKGKRSNFVRGEGGSILESRGKHGVGRHLLSGFLKCAECGASFYGLHTHRIYECGWHRDRGVQVCSNSLRVLRLDLEERVLGAIREQILVPEIIAVATQRVLEKVAKGLRREDPAASRKRLAQIEKELANLVRLAACTGEVEEVAASISGLERERARIRAALAAKPAIPSMDRLRAIAEARVREIRGALEGHEEERRAALRALLAGDRLRVGPDPERGYRVDGMLAVGATVPPSWGHRDVAGG
jgi:hypothetical protein